MVFLSCGYVGVHIEDGSRGGVDEDILIRKELVKLSRSELRERAMNLIRDDDTDTHNPRINHSHTFTAVHKKSEAEISRNQLHKKSAAEITAVHKKSAAAIVTRTLKEDDKFQASH